MKNIKFYINLASLLLVVILKVNAQDNQSESLAQKPLVDFDYNKPTFKLEEEQLSNRNRMLRFSVITGYREGVKPIKKELGLSLGVYNDPKIGTSKISMINLSIQDMLALGINPAQLVFDVKDASKYAYDPKYGDQQEWLCKNGWCYEFVLPTGAFPLDNILDFIRADVASQFNLKITKQKRMTDAEHHYGLPSGEPNREIEVLVINE